MRPFAYRQEKSCTAVTAQKLCTASIWSTVVDVVEEDEVELLDEVDEVLDEDDEDVDVLFFDPTTRGDVEGTFPTQASFQQLSGDSYRFVKMQHQKHPGHEKHHL